MLENPPARRLQRREILGNPGNPPPPLEDSPPLEVTRYLQYPAARSVRDVQDTLQHFFAGFEAAIDRLHPRCPHSRRWARLSRQLLPQSLHRCHGRHGCRQIHRRSSTAAHSQRALEAGLAAVLGRRMPDLDLLAHTIIALIHAAQRRHQLHPEEDLGRLFADLRRVVLVLIANRVERAGGV